MKKTENLLEKAEQAAARYLERRGYSIIDREPEGFGLVARDGEAIVFVEVRARDAGQRGFGDDAPDRSCFELAAASWLAAHAEEAADVPVRFDVVALLVIAADRALLRHHVNALEG